MLGQPRGGYGTIIIAWQPSMRPTAAHKILAILCSLKICSMQPACQSHLLPPCTRRRSRCV
jgi:hypothetical protein